MKKTTLSVLCLFTLIIFASCSGQSVFEGKVVAVGILPEFFAIETEKGQYGFAFDDETEFIFTDEMLEDIKYQVGEKFSDYFAPYMEAEVIAGEKTTPRENYIFSDVKDWFYAKTVKITKIHEEYFAVEG